MATQNEQFSADLTDYQRIGGGSAVKVVVDRFYQLILADEQLVGFFEDTDMAQLKRHQALLISQVLGGPANYDGRDLQEAHAGMDIARDDYVKVVSHLVQALEEAGVEPEIIGRVGGALAATEQDVVAAGAR
ncbi:MAG TPA: group 1 truncated hemoglobin [Nocardioidaceae bacterium]|nr:group 1 truncated hemoglobin [Nocardioidaceae bacterium]